MQWNANSILQRKTELMYFLTLNNIDVAAICETKLTPKRKFSAPGYKTYRTDRNQHGGGVMLLVKHCIRHEQGILPITSKLESVAVYICLPQRHRILLVSGYNPPGNTLCREDLDTVFSSPDPAVLLGDLKSKHSAWNCENSDRNGSHAGLLFGTVSVN